MTKKSKRAKSAVGLLPRARKVAPAVVATPLPKRRPKFASFTPEETHRALLRALVSKLAVHGAGPVKATASADVTVRLLNTIDSSHDGLSALLLFMRLNRAIPALLADASASWSEFNPESRVPSTPQSMRGIRDIRRILGLLHDVMIHAEYEGRQDLADESESLKRAHARQVQS